MAKGRFKVNGSNNKFQIKAQKEKVTIPFDVEKGDILWKSSPIWDALHKNHVTPNKSIDNYGVGCSTNQSYDPETGGDGHQLKIYAHLDDEYHLIQGASSISSQYGVRNLFFSPNAQFFCYNLNNNNSNVQLFELEKYESNGNIYVRGKQITSFNEENYIDRLLWSRNNDMFISTGTSKSGKKLINGSWEYIQGLNNILKFSNSNNKYIWDMSLDGKLLIYCDDSDIIMWGNYNEELNSFELVTEIPINQPLEMNCRAVKISPDNSILTFICGSTKYDNSFNVVKVYSKDIDSEIYNYIGTIELSNYITTKYSPIYIHPNNKDILLYCTQSNSIEHIILENNELLHYNTYNSSQIIDIFHLPVNSRIQGLFISPYWNDLLHVKTGEIFDIDNEHHIKCITPFPGTVSNSILGMCFSPDAKYAAIGGNKSFFKIYEYEKYYDTYTQEIPVIAPGGNTIYCCDFSLDGEYLAVGHNTAPYLTIYKKNNGTFTKLPNIISPGSTIYRLKFTIDNRIICQLSNSPYLIAYQQNSDSTFSKLPNITNAKAQFNFDITKDGNYIVSTPSVSTRDLGLFLYEWQNDNYVLKDNIPVTGYSNSPTICFSPDDKLLYHKYGNNWIIYQHNEGNFTEIPTSEIKGLPNGNISALSFNTSKNNLLCMGSDSYGIKENKLLSQNYSFFEFEKISDSSYNGFYPTTWDTLSPISNQMYGNYIKYIEPLNRIYISTNRISEYRINERWYKNSFSKNKFISTNDYIYIVDKNQNQETEAFKLEIQQKS